MQKEKIEKVLNYLKKHDLILITAESCTAGRIIELLTKIEGSGQCLDAGYVTYSEEAKKRLLNVKQKTIDTYTLASEEVAEEMAKGALKDSKANLVVATTGIAGPEPMDGKKEGTVCFAWGFKQHNKRIIFTQTKHFTGNRINVQKKAAQYALEKISTYHKRLTSK